MKYFAIAICLLLAVIYHVQKTQEGQNEVIVQRSSPEPAYAEETNETEVKDETTNRADPAPPTGTPMSAKRRPVKRIRDAQPSKQAKPTEDFSPTDLNQLVEFGQCPKCNLQGADLSGLDLALVDLKEANLKGANLTGANLKDADLEGANLEGADLTETSLVQTSLKGANLSGARLVYSDLTYGDAAGANFSGADFTGTKLIDLHMDGTNLSGANLSGVDATGVTLKETIFDETTKLQGTILHDNRDFNWKSLSRRQQCEADIIAEGFIPECP
ncbi:pentapeptide repeat-containing protein [Pseudobacteriovorax antillogorgiicola]|uniref:Uncharacterized protein YjbI, contains pentapeptide repeats n=1 Tax=Pseudobacteriovorax antillogorgiicola TaxID=1513793 RepID=A0A1Y6CNH2_9BACT|nr:pentapeptide repeat-containing protein [Pseudobacteriovorax antillogorgiicola]TCS43634.1 uncharacterized protein YjbI with pentapeptide repeats [Pseudobacteriovorax antillogorgiicola]SMF79981.1 Uncharacterized protein YjbI, contains pentapeptide repeats [Pseudobacteriovorax antillogorgiicola]